MENNPVQQAKAKTQSLIVRLADKFGVDHNNLLRCLTSQVFKQTDGAAPSNEELMVLLLVCENYGLNPFNREIFAFRNKKSGSIIPIVSLDGWCKIVRNQKDFNGMSFSFADQRITLPGYREELPEYAQCSIRRKGIDEPITVQEFMVECFNENSPVWKKWPRRMLRTRAFIQCARLAFGLSGLYDEGDVNNEGTDFLSVPSAANSNAADALPKLTLQKPQLEKMVAQLAAHAHQRADGWNVAQQWVEQNLSGTDRSFALAQLQQLCTAKEAVTPPIQSPEQETQHAIR